MSVILRTLSPYDTIDFDASLNSNTPFGDVTSNISLWYGGMELRENENMGEWEPGIGSVRAQP